MRAGDYVRVAGYDVAGLILKTRAADPTNMTPKLYEVLVLELCLAEGGDRCVGSYSRNQIRLLCRDLTETEQAGLALWRLTHG